MRFLCRELAHGVLIENFLAMYKDTLKNLIKQDEIQETLDSLGPLVIDDIENQNIFIQIYNQYSNYKKNTMTGLISNQDLNILKATIVQRILALIDELPNDEYYKNKIEFAKNEYLRIKDIHPRENNIETYKNIFLIFNKYKNTIFMTAHTYEIFGALYEQGLGIEKNEEMAYEHFQKSSDGGFGWGSYHLANIFMRKKDYGNAILFYRKAIESKEGRPGWAYVQMGDIYRDGKGVEKDFRKALEYYTKATLIDPGLSSVHWAYHCIGDLFMRHGAVGLDRDPFTALHFFKKAKDLGNSDAQKRIVQLEQELSS